MSINLPHKATVVTAPSLKKGSRSGSINVGKSDSLSETDTIKSEALSLPKCASANIGVTDVASAVQPIYAIGNEVFYRHKSRSQANAEDGEGITCKIKEIIEPSQGKQRRYKIQDAEPAPGETPPIYNVTINSLVAIPTTSAGLPALAKGKQVLAKYPYTTTFYRAEVVGTGKKDTIKLRFEDEDQPGTEKDVERRYVLDVK